MNYHKYDDEIVCHYCGKKERVPESAPNAVPICFLMARPEPNR
jgi:hypothetical protein